jgi:hypothetical protein
MKLSPDLQPRPADQVEELYIQERAFSGFTLTVAAKLAEFIEIRQVGTAENNVATKVKFNIKLPDANSLSTLLLDWDPDKLNALPPQKQKEILATLDNLRRSGKLKFIEGEEELTLVRENGLWRVLFDWAAGLRVQYDATVPSNKLIEATADPATSVRATSCSPSPTVRAIYQRVIAPASPTRRASRSAPHLDLVECALLLPVKLNPGEDRGSHRPTWSRRPARQVKQLKMPMTSKSVVARRGAVLLLRLLTTELQRIFYPAQKRRDRPARDQRRRTEASR